MNYYLSTDGDQVTGPHSLDEITSSVHAGVLPHTAQVCPEGGDAWQPVAALLLSRQPPPLPVVRHSTASGPRGLTIDDRSSILDAYIRKYVEAGYRVTSRTDTTAQLVKPKEFSVLAAVICLLLAFFPFLLYLLFYLAEKDKTAYISIAADGQVTQSQTA